jgi:branched-chain amino acid aminotransferase
MKGALTLINGNIYSPEEAKISIFDRGFLFGDSIYEVTISHDRKLLFFDEHLSRFQRSAKLIGLDLDFTKEIITENAIKLLQAFNEENAYIRMIVTRGIDEIALNPSNNIKQNLIMITKKAPFYESILYDKGIYLNLVERKRNDKEALDPNAKSGNYLNNILAIKEAKKSNAYDAIMENQKGEVTEGTTFNIWFIKNKQIFTPHAKSGLLEGITRAKLLEFCRNAKLDVQEVTCTKEDFYNADEVFITSSTKGIMPVYQLNSRVYHEKLSDNSITKKLMNLYNENVKVHLNETPYIF